MTTATINYQELAGKLGATNKRLRTIVERLFGDIDVTQEVALPHIEAVLERIKKHGETVAIACDAYKLEVTKNHQQQHQTQTPNGNAKPGKGSITQLLESDRSATKKLTQKRFAAILRESNELLASWLTNGIPEDELSDDLEAAIIDSDDMVLDALTESIDATGAYQYDAPKSLSGGIAALLMPSPEPHTNGNGKRPTSSH